ncbi:MAG TPA: hypothetical protein VK144_00930 [Bacillota bacterium]|nr:hypothetical protein [Bacillota bacterium]
MSEQELFTNILKKMIAKTENETIQTSEQLIEALIIEMSMNNNLFTNTLETKHA